jgi:hypothetical protein
VPSAATEGWKRFIAGGEKALLDEILADDVVFQSPVVHTPQRGKQITGKYLMMAHRVLGSAQFRYVGEWAGEHSCVLEFVTEIDGIAIEGVDIIHWNEAGKIVLFKVMVRPLQAINLLHERMGQALAGAAP